uniref:Sel1 repeat-containing protein n=1 Tax=Candidatus Kentrum sp. LPFa TaxID=2126335 RepID=A0A450W9E3_9GAMM|nr:MAG: hypothetical protein BECKLPF1236B_GA0070989_105011 [Candidatus Kentron sp. LPFa]
MYLDLRSVRSRRELLEPRQKGTRKWVRVVLFIMIVALVGWYFLGDMGLKGNNQPQPDKSPTAESGVSRGSRIPSAVRESENFSPTRSLTAVTSGKQAREVIQDLRNKGEKIDLDHVFRRAEQFESKKMWVDAYLMHFFAARQGHADSAMVLGTMYDPDHTLKPIGIMVRPNWSQAHKWYLRAAEGGNQAARKRLEYLRKQMETAAAKGDVEAGRLVLQWR